MVKYFDITYSLKLSNGEHVFPNRKIDSAKIVAESKEDAIDSLKKSFSSFNVEIIGDPVSHLMTEHEYNSGV